MEDSAAVAALPYQEPPIKTILILSSFLVLLNAVNHILDRLVYCGLIGQVLIGVAFGTPGAKWLDKGTEQIIVHLGYLGLILLVYEGGLNTSFRSLKSNLGLSVLVALTGICLPIAFAFCLQSLASATPLQAFAAGAALCSTSLGTTFTILNTSGLTNTRLGTVLTSAAMMDDVVGLVLVQVISKLGSDSSSFHPITIVRPIVVSIGLVLFVILTCRYLVKPVSSLICGRDSSAVMRIVRKQPDEAALIAHTVVLFVLVAAASYAGTSSLFAAYLAGASISWYDTEVAQRDKVETIQSTTTSSVQQAGHNECNVAGNEKLKSPANGTDTGKQLGTPGVADTLSFQEPAGQHLETEQAGSSLSGASIYKKYIQQPIATILKAFFFASIGFSIPITLLFNGGVVWRGIVFTTLMLLGKLVTGGWLVRIAALVGTKVRKIKAMLGHWDPLLWSYLGLARLRNCFSSRATTTADNREPKATPDARRAHTLDGKRGSRQSRDRLSQSVSTQPLNAAISSPPPATAPTMKSRSLYPAAIIGTAMMARGEIGFLIAALAESKGIFASRDESPTEEDGGSRLYLVVTWAVVLCTVIGPVSVGLLVRRVKKLQRQRRELGGGEDPLGIWAVL